MLTVSAYHFSVIAQEATLEQACPKMLPEMAEDSIESNQATAACEQSQLVPQHSMPEVALEVRQPQPPLVPAQVGFLNGCTCRLLLLLCFTAWQSKHVSCSCCSSDPKFITVRAGNALQLCALCV